MFRVASILRRSLVVSREEEGGTATFFEVKGKGSMLMSLLLVFLPDSLVVSVKNKVRMLALALLCNSFIFPFPASINYT